MHRYVKYLLTAALMAWIAACGSVPLPTTPSVSPVPIGPSASTDTFVSPVATLGASELAGVSGRIVFERGDDLFARLYVYDWSTSTATELRTTALESREPVWSPNGQQIAFTAKQSGGKFEIRVIDRDGTGEQILIADGSNNWAPAWSPDGSQLAFVSDRGGSIQIYVSDREGSGARALTSAGNNWAPDWSPDDTKIIFVSDRDQNRELYTIRPDGTGEARLTHTPLDEDRPAWSPDGFFIAFLQMTERTQLFDSSEIMVMGADGAGIRRYTHNTDGDVTPHWSPDGHYLIFSSNRTGTWNLYLIRLTDGASTLLSWGISGREISWADK